MKAKKEIHISLKYFNKTHQIKAKFCLKLQNITPDSVFKCSICDKSFNVKSSCDRHQEICITNPIKLTNKLVLQAHITS